MTWLRSIGARISALIRKRQLDEELDDELRFCLEMETDENIRQGMEPGEARRKASMKIGGTDQLKEVCRDERGFPLVESLLQDLRHSVRSLCHSPGFTLVVVIILAIGIGANTAIFSLLDGAMLRPFPVPKSHELF